MNFVRRAVLLCFLVLGFAALSTQAPGSAAADATVPTTQASATQPDSNRRVLTTKHFTITITLSHSDDPFDITDDHVIYEGVSRRRGKSIRLIGSTFYHLDADGTPDGFQGYKFHNKDISYRVYISGDLEIRRNNILLAEHGTWDR